MQQRLHYNAILLGLLLKSHQLFLRCLRRTDIEIDPYTFKSDRHRFGHSQCPLQVQISFNDYLDVVGRYPDGGGNHLASDLCTSGQCPE